MSRPENVLHIPLRIEQCVGVGSCGGGDHDLGVISARSRRHLTADEARAAADAEEVTAVTMGGGSIVA